jgi:hypothetical protein
MLIGILSTRCIALRYIELNNKYALFVCTCIKPGLSKEKCFAGFHAFIPVFIIHNLS